jgi:hypothetical protein
MMQHQPVRTMRDGTESATAYPYGAWSIVARRPGGRWSPYQVGFRSEAAALTTIQELPEPA